MSTAPPAPVRPVYARPDLCPACWTALTGPACTRCGLVPAGPAAVEVLGISRELDRILHHRALLLTALRSGTAAPPDFVPAMTPPPGTGPAVYARPDLCPACWTALTGPACTRCGLDLTGPLAAAVLQAGTRLDRWLARRSDLIELLRRPAAPAVAGAPRPPAAPVTTGPVPADPAPAPPVLPDPVPATSVPAAPPAAPAETHRFWKVAPQLLLVGVGALLLAAAAIIFLAFAWDQMGVRGRSAVVAVVSLAAVAGSVVTRRRLVLTGEALGALSVVLLVLDAFAARASGLIGTGLTPGGYVAVACAVLAGLHLLLARYSRVRAFAWGAAVLGPLTPALAGVAVAEQLTRPQAVLVVAGVGALGSALLGALARGRATGAPATVAAAVGYVLLLPGLAAGLLSLPFDRTATSVFLVVVTAAAVAHSYLSVPLRAVSSVVAGVSGALALVIPVLDRVDTWWLLVAPMLAGALALGTLVAAPHRPVRNGPLPRMIGWGALAVFAVSCLPAAALTFARSVTVLQAAIRPYQAGPGDPWSSVSSFGGSIPHDRAVASVLTLVLAGVVALAWGRLTRDRGWVTVAAQITGLTAVSLPWWEQVPVAGVVGTGLVLAAAMILAARATLNRPGLSAVATAGTVFGSVLAVLTVIAAWTSEPLAVPVTALGIAALVLVRVRTGRTVVLLPAVVATYISAAGLGVSAHLPAGEQVFPLLWTAVTLTVLVLGLPRARLGLADRQLLAVCGGVPALAGLVWLAGIATTLTGAHPRTVPTLVLCLVATALAAADRLNLLPAVVRVAAVPLAVVLAAATALDAFAWAGWNDPALALALAAAGVAGIVGGALQRGLTDPRLTVLEACLGLLVLCAVVAVFGQEHPWPALLVLAAAGLLIAIHPRRRPVAWASWAFGAAALWDLLSAGAVAVVEWFTVPPALVLIAAGTVSARRDGRVLRPTLLAGVLLAVLPTAAVAVQGTPVRATVLLVLGAVAAGAVVLLRRADRARHVRLTVLVGVPTAVAVTTGVWGRGVRDLVVTDAIGGWVVAAGAVLAVLATVGWGWPRTWSAVGLSWLVGLPLVAAVDGSTPALIRHLAVVVVAGAVLVGAEVVAARSGRRGASGLVLGGQLVLLALTTGTGLLAQAGPGGHPVEAVIVPVALVVLVVGWLRMRAPQARSWTWVAPGLLLGLVPPLVLSLTGGSVTRVVLLTIAAAAVLVVGSWWRWQSPIIVGGAVLAVHAVAQLGPYAALLYAAMPRWVVLALVGAALLALGARYENRVADLMSARRRLRALR